ncbi:MAG: DUF421 domain-containing protein [Acutalibacter sp.]|jgi:uncharacterized membrane protein YcaP (DUF421 family)
MVVRTMLMYGAILVAVRVMGKRQISQLQTSELVVTLLISELAMLPIQEGGQPLWTGLLPMGVLVLCELLVSLAMLKSSKFRQLVCGSPTVVIQRGQILQKEMRRLRLTTEDLLEQLRQNGVFYLEDVAWAIIETNGMMSVIRRPEEDPVTPHQLQLKADPAVLEVSVISDGEVSLHSLQLCGKDKDWLDRRLREQGVAIQDVFLMTARTDGKWRIIQKPSK